MRWRNFPLPVVALAGIGLFMFLLVRILLLRYERGDVYPAYSTLRTDPLGTRAFYDSLDSLGSYPVGRGFRSLEQELKSNPGTLILFGLSEADLDSYSQDDIAQLDAFVKNGGRLIVTLDPVDPVESSDKTTTDSKDLPERTRHLSKWRKPEKSDTIEAHERTASASVPTATPPPEPEVGSTEQERYERAEFHLDQAVEKKIDPDFIPEKFKPSLGAKWGFGKDRQTREKGKTYGEFQLMPDVDAERRGGAGLEASVPWKSALYFLRTEPEWETLYSAKSKPVMIRRTWGKGEIIIATDSYFISNEALRKDRRPVLLGTLTGPPGTLLFDEAHLGTQQQEGIMFLAREFRLEGYMIGMLLVVLLFLWRNSVPLVPPRVSQGAPLGGSISGKDSRSGLVNLLRRNIPAAGVLRTALTEWKRTATPGRTHLQEKAAAMEAIVAAAESGKADRIVPSYHQLREINHPRRGQETYATKP